MPQVEVADDLQTGIAGLRNDLPLRGIGEHALEPRRRHNVGKGHRGRQVPTRGDGAAYRTVLKGAADEIVGISAHRSVRIGKRGHVPERAVSVAAGNLVVRVDRGRQLRWRQNDRLGNHRTRREGNRRHIEAAVIEVKLQKAVLIGRPIGIEETGVDGNCGRGGAGEQ